MSGVKNVYISLKDKVAQFPKLPTNRTSYEDFAVLEGNIVMVNGQRFYHIYCSRDMGELKYTTQGTFGGKSMKANLEIYHPGFKPNSAMKTAARKSATTWRPAPARPSPTTTARPSPLSMTPPQHRSIRARWTPSLVSPPTSTTTP